MNAFDDIVLATLHTMQEVQKGQAVGGTRIIPLLIEEEKIARLESTVSGPVIEVLPFRPFKVGMVTTGNEVYSGRIKDAFGPVLRQKFESLGSSILGQSFSDDSIEMTVQGNPQLHRAGRRHGGLHGRHVRGSRRPHACRHPRGGRQGGHLRGSHLPRSHVPAGVYRQYSGTRASGCVMYHRASIFDLVVPRLLAGIPVTREDIVALGHGGFCAGCGECRYPNCAFGKN